MNRFVTVKANEEISSKLGFSAKVNALSMLENLQSGVPNQTSYHLMVVRVKNTNIMYSFYIEATIVDSSIDSNWAWSEI